MNRKNVLAAVWLIGLGVLFLFDLFWPGILILIGISLIVTNFMPEETGSAPPQENPSVAKGAATAESVVEGAVVEPAPIEVPLPPALTSEADRLYLASRLPERCPACDAPMKANAAQMELQEDGSTVCLFCGYRLEFEG
jgi:hypothetical protein